MAAHDNRRMLSRALSFIVWALVAATCVFWALRLLVPASDVPSRAVTVGDASAAHANISRLFGAAPAEVVAAPVETLPPDVGARFRLAGVMAPKQAGDSGVALISVDGKPARVYRVGASIDGDLMLGSVSLRSATVVSARAAQAPGSGFVLEMPMLTAAATGVLPGPSFNGAVGSTPVAPQMTPAIAPDGRDALAGMEPPAAGRPSVPRDPRTR